MADLGLAAVFALALAFQAARLASTWGGGYWWFDAAAGAVVSVLALVRYRGRAVAATAGLTVAVVSTLAAWAFGLPSEPGPAMALALAVLTGSAVRELPARSACAVAAGGLAVIGVSLLTQLGSSSGMPVVILNSLTWLGGVSGGLVPRLLAARRRRISERVRRDERLELARELHDVVAHHITGIVIEAQAGQLDAIGQPDRARASFAAIEGAGTEALTAVRSVVGLLRDTDGAAFTAPGPERLTALVERFRERGGPAVELRLREDGEAWPPEVAATVYRVVQESLTNVARHAAGADSVTVRVARDGRDLTVEVTDDAPYPSRHRRRDGYGLVGMRERVEALGGTLRAGPARGGGWSVLAVLPAPDRGDR
ncbi:sensor histidine kinase [Nocardiopsis deserti]|uniref:sensor histidine kinase n=1 Tax=Nocardiopsis deserti TaxID=2605988 RepID=UPI001238B0CE|nr:histidine kinase [Nocardiopsis deserti]